jgi:hypothetical protein
MPDGFEPHTELARIYTLRELMQGCRGLAGEVIDELKELIHHIEPDIRLRAMQMALDRGFGKPRQHHVISDFGEASGSRVNLYLPDNGRSSGTRTGIVIDAEVA